ncbi:MAG: GntR family transcriptional regulator [Clostridia bacterium]|nr:GntR family transcriptional regulator [Clostridia bacterium]
MINFELQNHKPLREIVYEELKRQIMIGEIAPHTRMMEVELADEMGVSRTPIREAIRKLEKEGLVTIEPRKGAYAADISIKEMVDVFDVREYLEGMAASLAAQKISAEEKAELVNIAESFKNAVEDGNIQMIVKIDEEFHKFIVKCSDNKTLVQLIMQVQDLSLRFRYIYYDDFSRFEHIPTEHAEIVSAILSGDPEKARLEMSAHIRELRQFVVTNSEKIANK